MVDEEVLKDLECFEPDTLLGGVVLDFNSQIMSLLLIMQIEVFDLFILLLMFLMQFEYFVTQ